MEKTTEPQAFERELADLMAKHGVTRMIAAFNDVDRNPYLVSRLVTLKSGPQWACQAMFQLAEKIKLMIEDGRLKPENELEPPSPEMVKKLMEDHQ